MDNIVDIFDIAKLSDCRYTTPIMETRCFFERLAPLIKQCYAASQFPTTASVYRVLYDTVSRYVESDYIELAARLAKTYDMSDVAVIEQAIAACFVYRQARPMNVYVHTDIPEVAFKALTQVALQNCHLISAFDNSNNRTMYHANFDICGISMMNVGKDTCSTCKYFKFNINDDVICSAIDKSAGQPDRKGAKFNNMSTYAKSLGLQYEHDTIYEACVTGKQSKVYLHKGKIVGMFDGETMHYEQGDVTSQVLALACKDNKLFKRVNAFPVNTNVPAYIDVRAVLPTYL